MPPKPQHVYYVQLNREVGLLHLGKQGGRVYGCTTGSGRPIWLISVEAVSTGERSSGCKYPDGDSYDEHFLLTLSIFTLGQEGRL